MSATMTGLGGGIDLAARRATAERLWRQHTGGCCLGLWVNPGGYTLRATAHDGWTPVGELTIRASEVRYRPISGVFTAQEQAAVRAVRDALIGGQP